MTPPPSLPLAAALAYGAGFWLVVLHHAEGGHEHGEPSLLVHWLRDSTLALPGVLVAVWLGLWTARRLLERNGVSGALERAFVATTVAVAASGALAAGSPFHAWLFEAHEGHDLPLLAHILRDALLALGAALPIAALATLARPRRGLRLAPAVAAVAALAATSGGAVRAAHVDPGSPCPVTAPIKRFDVQAIDVDIPLNRFGDHDPAGKMYVLAGQISAVRNQEQNRKVQTGLRDDPIQPLVIRANQGDCVEIKFVNNASGGAFGVHIDGLSYEIGSSGDAVGANAASTVPRGDSHTYRYFVPNDARLEGAHVVRPGPGMRSALSHGLLGVLVVEPPGSTYRHPKTGAALESGWDAVIVPGSGAAFREFVPIYHEIGDENTQIRGGNGSPLPQTDPITKSYRPGSRALNYRSEPFFNRLQANNHGESQGYGSYMFGDPPTPMPRSYLAEPTKFRLVHAGSEMFHVHHQHGGGIRWRFNPKADHTYNYADTGLNKRPVEVSESTRLDSQAIGPSETYNLEIEGGAGGVQQSAGDFLYHCHIAHHYVSGMWSFWRVFDTRQGDLLPLPNRTPPPDPVDSAGLIGRTMPDGTTLTAAKLDDWIRPQLPPQGVTKSGNDASVWDWIVDDRTDPTRPIYLGEPEDTGTWPNLPNLVPGHPGSLPGDQLVGNRPKILFNPVNGRPAYPLLRPHIGKRPPFSSNGHSGAPWLGERGDQQPGPSVDPYARRRDGICPAGSPLRRFNVVSIELPIRVTRSGTDPVGKIFVLAKNKDGVRAGLKPAEPLAIRANVGDCVAHTFTNETTDANATDGFSKVNMHIHHVQFDVQGSDGVISGLAYEQSVRPYKAEDPQLAADAVAGATTLALSSVAKFQRGVWIGIGLGTEGIEIRQIASIDAALSTVTLTRPLERTHSAGEWAGTEFVQYRWFPDVQLDNVFWHDHVDGIHTWRHGLVGQIIVEPPGSTYHDPVSGAEVDSGTLVDVRTANPLVPGIVTGSFRELALWTIDENPISDATLNLRAEPWNARLSANGDQSLLFSSYTHGDPVTPLPRAYPGDPVVIRLINAGPMMDTLHVDGRFFLENRYPDAGGSLVSTPVDTVHHGISERFTIILEGGAGGPLRAPGDYLYMNSVARHFRQGAWGILRVLGSRVDDLQPLPGTTPPAPGALPTPTGGRPPEPADPGNPCPAGAPTRSFQVSAVDLPTNNSGPGNNNAVRAAFVPTADAAAAKAGRLQPEPLVLHAAAGECVTVRLTNERPERASFHLGDLLRTAASSGVNVGFGPEQSVAPGTSRTYRFYADTEKIDSALVADLGSPDAAEIGMYGALVVAPPGATFTDPGTGAPKDVGAQVDVHVPSGPGYRDFTVILADQDPEIGQNVMPYPTEVKGPALVNYRSAPRKDTDQAFSSAASGAPRTPVFRAVRGDRVRVHALVAPASEQTHVFSLGGFSWSLDPRIENAEEVEARGIGPWEAVDAEVAGGAGGRAGAVGDFFYGDLRRPFTLAGMWGLQRVLAATAGCQLQPVDGMACGPALDATAPTVALTAPSAAAAVAGVVALAAEAADNVGVTGVRFRVDAVNVGAEDSAAPFSATWDTKLWSDGLHALSAVARDAAGNATGSANVTVTVDNTAPTAVLGDPGPSLRGTATLTATATDATSGVASVAFQRAPAGAATWTTIATDSTAPYAASFDTTVVADGLYDLRAVATDTAGNQTPSAVVAGRRVDNTAPAVSLTAPAGGATVSATAGVSAEASDAVGVTGVQFRLDGAPLGAEDTIAPYSVSWDTTTAANGPHTLTAVARDAAGNVTTSAAVAVSVSNAAVATGLVAAYAFDEGAGTTVGDASGSGNGGTVSGAAWSAAGKFGGALSFDGVDDWVTVADSASLDLTTGMTLEGWVRPASLPAWPTVLMKEGATDLVYALYANSGLTGPMGFATSAVTTHSTTKLTTGAWTHLAVTYDGSVLALYVNGAQASVRLLSITIPGSTGSLRIGGNGIWGEFFHGLVDEVRIYNRRLTATEIEADMATAIGSSPPAADTTAPTVSVTSPVAGATLSGAVSVTADASDNVGVAGVQFKLDGANLGAEDTAGPYAASWDTTTAANGSHTLSAVARDAAGNTTTSASVTVTVDNAAPPPPPPPSGLVAAYSFNEGTGTTIADASGTGNGGTVSGATWATAGKFGGALSFDGIDDWVTVADSASLDLTTSMTLEAWVKPSTLPAWPTVLMKEGAGDLVYAVYGNSNVKGPMGFATSGVTAHSEAKLALAAWTHLAVTYDGSSLRLYVNGAEASVRLLSTAMPASAGPLRIGGNGIWGEWFNGLIDEVRIYSRVLTAAEIQTDMTTAISP